MDGAERRRNISIHALREEGDARIFSRILMVSLFLSTPSARRATHQRALERTAIKISIHALREEGDKSACTNLAEAGNFYPRPPRGGRPEPRGAANLHLYFYPRPPRGGRQLFRGIIMSQKQFLSTPSARRATYDVRNPLKLRQFLSTPSARRATSIVE